MTGRIKILKASDGLPVSPTSHLPSINYAYDVPDKFDAECGTYGLNTFQLPNGKMISLRNADVRDKLRSVVGLIGEDVLGFKGSEIGLHSICSGGAMAMFLSGTPTIIIMRVG